MANKVSTVNFQLSRGIRLHGKSIFPTVKQGNKDVPAVITIRESLARELASASKGKIVDAKANVKIATPETDELAAAFGEDGGDE